MRQTRRRDNNKTTTGASGAVDGDRQTWFYEAVGVGGVSKIVSHPKSKLNNKATFNRTMGIKIRTRTAI